MEKEKKVEIGFTYSDEDGDDVTVLYIYKKWALVCADMYTEKPWLERLDFIQAIKNDSEDITNAIN